MLDVADHYSVRVAGLDAGVFDSPTPRVRPVGPQIALSLNSQFMTKHLSNAGEAAQTSSVGCFEPSLALSTVAVSSVPLLLNPFLLLSLPYYFVKVHQPGENITLPAYCALDATIAKP